VDIVVGIGMAHVRGEASRRITLTVPRLRRSESRSFDTQPFRAGLTFGGRPSGPRRRAIRPNCLAWAEVCRPSLRVGVRRYALTAWAELRFADPHSG
jgi:hypothetical protein